MSKNVFISKSSRLAKDKKLEKRGLMLLDPKPIQVGLLAKNAFIAWIGRDFSKQDHYGFKNIDISKLDLSILVNAKLLIVIYTSYSKKVNAAVNFACEYGIPILWINSILPPVNKAWFFNEVSNSIYWELICQMAK